MPHPVLHASHWGTYHALVEAGRVVGVAPHPDDPDPSPLLANVAGTAHHPTRVAGPAARRGWLEGGPGPDGRRGADEWVALSWDEALDRVAGELQRVADEHGPEARYAGSYGWASAGRFHHPQSHLRRFFGLTGGATLSVGTYSSGASEVLLPHVLGDAEVLWRDATTWEVIAAETDLLVCFGGLPAKNASVTPGGLTRHTVPGALRRAGARGLRVVSISPIADEAPPGAEWVPIRPGTDVAAMLGVSHALLASGRADLDFCRRCCRGTDELVAYVTGRSDGVAKDPAWASAISGIPAARLRRLAEEMTEGRTLLTTSLSLQRAEHGEQAPWMSIALAALVGQIGLPGGGVGHGYGSMAHIGETGPLERLPSLPGSGTSLRSWIPVARVGDLLCRPGQRYEVNGEVRTYPDVRLVYWAGGNPFHHHQDLNRLRRGLRRMDTVIVHEPYWTATARHADVVLPATLTLEREDIGGGRHDARLVAMRRALVPHGSARDDYAIFAGLAERSGVGEAFTEGRDAHAWLAHLYGELRARLAARGHHLPGFETFWAAGEVELPARPAGRVHLARFRADPVAHPLRTPSGRIELWSPAIAGFGYDDCPPHPAWLEPTEWAGSARARVFPLVLVANNPATRLHSQLDAGEASRAAKVAGREPVRIHPRDAARRGIRDGQVVRVWNDRGACLAGAVLSATVTQGVVQLSTGAWYDPDDPAGDGPLCVHGNPNVLTPDVATSRLAQACAGQHALVDVAPWEGPVPPVTAHVPPRVGAR